VPVHLLLFLLKFIDYPDMSAGYERRIAGRTQSEKSSAAIIWQGKIMVYA
jgi:hypothetical protein